MLLYNEEKKTVILTKQLRIPIYFNGDNDGMLIEVCAGLRGEDEPKTAIKKEIEEETGYCLERVKKMLGLYMSPRSVTVTIHLFIASYTAIEKVSAGGGAQDESEDIEVLKYAFAKAYDMIQTAEVKVAKAVILLQYLRLKEGV